MQRVWRILRWDLLIAVVLTAWNQWELSRAEFTDGAVLLNHVTFALMTASVALRRSAPLACASIASAGLLAQTIWGGDVYGTAAQFVAQLIATHAAGSHPDRNRALIGLAVIFVAVESYPFVSEEPLVIADEVGNAAAFFAVWALARAVRSGEDDRARLAREQSERERSAIDRERSRVARELHDIVAHGLSVMVLHSNAARGASSDDAPEVQKSLDIVADAGRQAMSELHRLLGMLSTGSDQPVPVETLDDVRVLCDRMRTAGVAVALVLDAPPGVDRSVAVSVYRVVQEALTNALRHAPGAPVDVRIAAQGDAIEVVIENAAAQPQVESRQGTGLGLRGMRERVELFGGSFDAGSTSRGWRVRALIPARAASPTS